MNIPTESFLLSHHVTDSELRSIEVFIRRAYDFVEIRKKSKLQTIQGSMERLENGKFSGKSNIPDEAFLKEFYMAFRFFYLIKEESHFLKVINILSRNIEDAVVKDYLKSLKTSWKKTMKNDTASSFTGRVIKGEEYIDYWFNAHYFHSSLDKEFTLKDINQFLSEDMSRFYLFTTVLSLGACVGLLYKAIKSYTKNNPVILVPMVYMHQNA